MSKINILVVPSDNKGGVGFYRSTQPHIQLEKQFPDDFSVTFEMNPNFRDLSYFDKFQIIHIHKGLFQDREGFLKALDYFNEKKIVTVMDIDDNWKLTAFKEKPTGEVKEMPGKPGYALASMGNYIFDNDILQKALSEDAKDANSSHDFGNDIIPKLIFA